MTDAITHAALCERLMNSLNRNEDNSVCLVRKSLTPSIGSCNIIPITGMSLGFDWDRGRTFLHTEGPVYAVDEQYTLEKSSVARMADKLGYVHLILGNKSLSAEEKVRNIQLTLRRK